MPSIVARRVLTPNRISGPTEVSFEGGLITAVRPTGPGAAPLDGLLVPGFIDLQVNGIDDLDVSVATGADWDRLDALLLAQGVTTWCPTVVTAPLASYDAVLERIATAMVRPAAGRPAIAGIHLEGPFLGGAPGAHPQQLLLDPDLDWLAALPPAVRIMTLAPERKGALEAVQLLGARDVVVSLGHSTATHGESTAAIDAGASLVTHLFNGMGPLHHREPGLLGAALADPRVVASLIADLVHVHPAVLRTAFTAKPRGIALVTDAVAWRAERVGRLTIELRDGAPRLGDGTLAGSALSMDTAIRNVVRAAGVDLAAAVTAATATPAGVLGLHDRGRIDVGCRADFVLLDDDLRVQRVWVSGEAISPKTRG